MQKSFSFKTFNINFEDRTIFTGDGVEDDVFKGTFQTVLSVSNEDGHCLHWRRIICPEDSAIFTGDTIEDTDIFYAISAPSQVVTLFSECRGR